MQLSFLDALLETTKQQEGLGHDSSSETTFPNQEAAKIRPSKRVKSNTGTGLEVVLEDETTRLANSLWKKVCTKASQVSCNLTAESGESIIQFSPLDLDFKFPTIINDTVKTESLVQPTNNINSSQKKLIEFLNSNSHNKDDSFNSSSIDSLLANHQLRHLMGLETQTQKDNFQCLLDHTKQNINNEEEKKRKILLPPSSYEKQFLLVSQEPALKRKLVETETDGLFSKSLCNKQPISDTATTRSSECFFHGDEQPRNEETTSFDECLTSSYCNKKMLLSDTTPSFNKTLSKKKDVILNKTEPLIAPTQINNKVKTNNDDKYLQASALESTQEQIFDYHNLNEETHNKPKHNVSQGVNKNPTTAKLNYEESCNNTQKRKLTNGGAAATAIPSQMTTPQSTLQPPPPQHQSNSASYCQTKSTQQHPLWLTQIKSSQTSSLHLLESMRLCMSSSCHNKLKNNNNTATISKLDENVGHSHSCKQRRSETRHSERKHSERRYSEALHKPETRHYSQVNCLGHSEIRPLLRSENRESETGAMVKLLSRNSERPLQQQFHQSLFSGGPAGNHNSSKRKNENKMQHQKVNLPASSPNYPADQQLNSSPKIIPHFTYKQNYELLKEFQSLMHKELASPVSTWPNQCRKRNRTPPMQIFTNVTASEDCLKQRKKLADNFEQNCTTDNNFGTTSLQTESSSYMKTPKLYKKEPQQQQECYGASQNHHMMKQLEKTTQRKPTVTKLTENNKTQTPVSSTSVSTRQPSPSSFHVIQLSTSKRKLPPLVVKTAGTNTNNGIFKTDSNQQQPSYLTSGSSPMLKRTDSPFTKPTLSSKCVTPFVVKKNNRISRS